MLEGLGRQRRVGRGARWPVMVLVMLAVAVAAGCGRSGEYSQETPDDVIRSAVAMVQNGDARRLPDLIHAESDDMRRALDRLGILLSNLQRLAVAIQQRFPKEVAELKARAEEAAEDGTVGQFSLSFGRGGPEAARRNERVIREQAAALFADPYGWIERSAARLSTLRLTDDMATVTLDNKPVFPPVGLPLTLHEDKWYIALPTHLPGVRDIFPRNETEWSIVSSAIAVLNNTVVDLTGDIQSGQISSLDQLSDKAGEKTIWPALLAWGAYQRELDVRRRRDRLGRQFDRRERDWVRARRESPAGLPERLQPVLRQLAPVELDRLSRRHSRPNIESMSDADFAEFLQGMLAAAGVTVSLAPDALAADVDAVIRAWEERQGGPAAVRRGR